MTTDQHYAVEGAITELERTIETEVFKLTHWDSTELPPDRRQDKRNYVEHLQQIVEGLKGI